jgi:4-amino-4-deoxy-L-arabinose transferase-like glycosyltransferase
MAEAKDRNGEGGEAAGRRGIAMLLALITLLAAGLRVYDLGGEPLWSDETLTARVARLPVAQILGEAPTWEHNPPLYALVMHAWVGLGGDAPVPLRIPSVLFGIAVVLIVFLVGRRLGGARLGLVAAFLAAISPFLIQYAQEARAYSLLALLSVASYYFFIRLVLGGGGSAGVAIGYGATTALLLYSHNHAIFVILAQAGTAAILARQRRGIPVRWLVALGAAVLAFAPWLPTLWMQSRIVASWKAWWLPAPDPRHLAWLFYHFAGFLPEYPMDPGKPGWFAASDLFWPFVVPLTLLTGGLAVVGCLRGHPGEQTPPEIGEGVGSTAPASREVSILLGLWFLVPVLAPFLLSLFLTPIFFPRFLIAAVPPLALLTARGILALSRRSIPIVLICLMFLALQAPGIARYYGLPMKEQWDGVTRLLEEEGRPDDLVVLASHFIAMPMEHHYRGSLDAIAINDFDEPFTAAAQLQRAMIGHRRLWFIDAQAGRRTAIRALQVLLPDGPESEHPFVGVKVLLYDLPARRARPF